MQLTVRVKARRRNFVSTNTNRTEIITIMWIWRKYTLKYVGENHVAVIISAHLLTVWR